MSNEVASNPERGVNLKVVADASAPAEAQPEIAPDQTGGDPLANLPIRKVVAFYKYVRADGGSGTHRVFLHGVSDLRTQRDIEAVEALILNRHDLVSVELTGWRSLEG